MTNYVLLYLWLVVTTFLNMFFIVSGSAIVNPVSAVLTDPYRAIGIGSLVFLIGNIQRTYLFRKEILADEKNKKILFKMIPFSVVGAFLGSLFISKINIKFLSIIIIITSVYFIYTTVIYLVKRNQGKHSDTKSMFGPTTVATLTGFIQGSSLPGADMRNNYLRTQISEVSVRAVNSLIGLFNFLVLSSVLLLNHKLLKTDLLFVVAFVPGLFITQYLAKKILLKLPDIYAKVIPLIMSVISLILFTYTMFFKS